MAQVIVPRLAESLACERRREQCRPSRETPQGRPLDGWKVVAILQVQALGRIHAMQLAARHGCAVRTSRLKCGVQTSLISMVTAAVQSLGYRADTQSRTLNA